MILIHVSKKNMNSNTVDRRNPAPVGIVNILSFTGFITGGAGFLPSTVSLRKINDIGCKNLHHWYIYASF